jgi:WD40 repeat protein
VFRSADGTLVRSFQSSSGDPISLAFSPDGAVLAIGTEEYQIELWRLADGVRLRSLTNYFGQVGTLAFNPDGKYLVGACEDYETGAWRSVKFWRVADGALVTTLQANRFTWSDIDQSFALVNWGSPDVLTFFTWSAEQPVFKAPGVMMLNGFRSLSPDFRYAVSGGETTLEFRRVADQGLVQRYDQEVEQITAFGFSRDGRFLAYGRHDASVLFARNPVGGLLATSQPPVIVVQPQSQSAEAGQETALWVKASGTEPLAYEWRLNGAALSGATNCVLVRQPSAPAHTETYSVVLRNAFGSVTSQVATVTITTPPTITAQPQSQTVNLGVTVSFRVSATADEPLSFQWRFNDRDIPGATQSTLTLVAVRPEDSGDYSVLVTGRTRGTKASAPATLAVQIPLRPLWQSTNSINYRTSVAFSPDGSSLVSVSPIHYVIGEDVHYLGTDVHLWNPVNGSTLRNNRMTIGEYRIAASADGTLAAALSYSGGYVLELWRVRENKLAFTLLRGISVTALAFSPEGILLTAATSSDIRIWRTSDGTLLHTFPNSSIHAPVSTFSQNGDYLAISGWESPVCVWQTASGEMTYSVEDPRYENTRLALSPDGAILALGGDDLVVQLRHLPDGNLLWAKGGHFTPITAMAFSRDGALLGVIRSGIFELWRTADGTLLPLNYEPPLMNVFGVAFSPTTNLLALVDSSHEYPRYYELHLVDYSAAIQPAPPRLSISQSPGACTLTLNGQIGRQYALLVSTNLTSWIELTNFTSVSLMHEIPDAGPRYPARFYRAIAR